MMEGNISDASTRASRDVWITDTASSGSCGLMEGLRSARLGRTPARTRTMILVNSKSCSMSSERCSPSLSSPLADGCVRHMFLAISIMTSWTSRVSVRASRSKSSIVSANTASWKTALPETDGRSILLSAERTSRVWTSETLPGLVVNASITIPKRTKKKAAGSSR